MDDNVWKEFRKKWEKNTRENYIWFRRNNPYGNKKKVLVPVDPINKMCKYNVPVCSYEEKAFIHKCKKARLRNILDYKVCNATMLKGLVACINGSTTDEKKYKVIRLLFQINPNFLDNVDFSYYECMNRLNNYTKKICEYCPSLLCLFARYTTFGIDDVPTYIMSNYFSELNNQEKVLQMLDKCVSQPLVSHNLILHYYHYLVEDYDKTFDIIYSHRNVTSTHAKHVLYENILKHYLYIEQTNDEIIGECLVCSKKNGNNMLTICKHIVCHDCLLSYRKYQNDCPHCNTPFSVAFMKDTFILFLGNKIYPTIYNQRNIQ